MLMPQTEKSTCSCFFCVGLNYDQDCICRISEECLRSQSVATEPLIQRDIMSESACCRRHEGVLTGERRVRGSTRRSVSCEAREHKRFSRWNFCPDIWTEEEKRFSSFDHHKHFVCVFFFSLVPFMEYLKLISLYNLTQTVCFLHHLSTVSKNWYKKFNSLRHDVSICRGIRRDTSESGWIIQSMGAKIAVAQVDFMYFSWFPPPNHFKTIVFVQGFCPLLCP